MSSTYLRAHEDLSGYLEVLDNHYRLFERSLNSMPIFSNDPEETIKDLLSQLVSTKKKAMEVTKLAKKFYKISEDTKKRSNELVAEISALQEEIGHLFSTLKSQEKEIDSKDKRLEDIEHEMQVVEKDFRAVLNEVNTLRKENRLLKETKPTGLVKQKTTLMKENEDYEEQNKRLKVEITELEEDVERKVKEIESLNAKIKDIIAFANNERNSAEKTRIISSSLKAELIEATEKAEDLEVFYESEKAKSSQLEQEVIKLKNHIEFLVKEYEKEKNCLNPNNRRLSIESRGPVEDDYKRTESFDSEIDSRITQRSRRNTRRTETLADWITEEEEEENFIPEIKSKTYFMITSPVLSSSQGREKDCSKFSIEFLPCQSFSPTREEQSADLMNLHPSRCRNMSCSVETADSLKKPKSSCPEAEDFKVTTCSGILIPPSYPSIHPSSVTLASRLNKEDQQDLMRVFFILVFAK